MRYILEPQNAVATICWIMKYTLKALIVAIFSFIVMRGALEITFRFTPKFQSFGWSDEIMGYLNIWLVFLGASLTAKANGHMTMDFFVKRFSPAPQAPAYQNELDNNVQGEFLKKMVAASLKVNEAADIAEFMKTLETFKQGYVKNRGPAWQDLYSRISAVK